MMPFPSTLENLLISSAEYGDVQKVFEDLAALHASRAMAMQQEGMAAPWRARAVKTVALLNQMQARAEGLLSAGATQG